MILNARNYSNQLVFKNIWIYSWKKKTVAVSWLVHDKNTFDEDTLGETSWFYIARIDNDKHVFDVFKHIRSLPWLTIPKCI